MQSRSPELQELLADGNQLLNTLAGKQKYISASGYKCYGGLLCFFSVLLLVAGVRLMYWNRANDLVFKNPTDLTPEQQQRIDWDNTKTIIALAFFLVGVPGIASAFLCGIRGVSLSTERNPHEITAYKRFITDLSKKKDLILSIVGEEERNKYENDFNDIIKALSKEKILMKEAKQAVEKFLKVLNKIQLMEKLDATITAKIAAKKRSYVCWAILCCVVRKRTEEKKALLSLNYLQNSP